MDDFDSSLLETNTQNEFDYALKREFVSFHKFQGTVDLYFKFSGQRPAYCSRVPYEETQRRSTFTKSHTSADKSVTKTDQSNAEFVTEMTITFL